MVESLVDVHAPLQQLEARSAGVVERDDLAVEHDVARAERLAEPPQLRIAARHVVAVAAERGGCGRRRRSRSRGCRPTSARTPSRRRGGAPSFSVASIGRRSFGRRGAAGIVGRIHAVDHPLLVAGAEQHVLPVHALAVERDHHLACRPTCGSRRCRCPRRPSSRRRTRRRGSRPGTSGTRADGPRSAPRGGCVFGSTGMPFGTAHDASTPSRSSRRSQCSARA